MTLRILGLFSKENRLQPAYDYDPAKEKPVIRESICTGEQVAGFKSRAGGEFHEVMLIRDNDDLKEFMNTYGLDHVDKEYP